MSINVTILDGNVTRDAELRKTQSGTKVLTFGFANNRRRGDQERTTFIDCTIFGERAEKLAPHIQKGTGLVLQGTLTWSQWERDGKKRSKHELIVDQLSFMHARKSEDEGEAAPEPAPVIADDLYDDDIPF